MLQWPNCEGWEINIKCMCRSFDILSFSTLSFEAIFDICLMYSLTFSLLEIKLLRRALAFVKVLKCSDSKDLSFIGLPSLFGKLGGQELKMHMLAKKESNDSKKKILILS